MTTNDDRRRDVEQINDVLLRYATGIDTKNWALFRTCFTDDARFDYGEIGQWSDTSGITEFMIAAHQGMSDTKHMLHNIVVDVHDDDHATAVTYVHTVQALAADPTQWIDGVGQYDDHLVRTDDGWHISARTFTQTRLFSSFDVLRANP